MPTYKNLPANRLELLDGNLIVDTPIEGNVVLVIGTAYSGPTGKQVLMNDSNLARKIYGAGSPILQKASEVKLGGAKNVLLYRIGGQPASLNGLFGADTYIRTVDETAAAGSDYSIYIGPQPSNPAEACLIVFQGTKIVYSNVTGSEVDLGKIVVEGFDVAFASRIGTPTSPVALQSALGALVDDSILNTTGDGSAVGFDLPGASNAATAIEYVKVNGLTVTTGFALSVGTGTAGADEVVFTTAPGNGDTIAVKFNRPKTVAGAAYVAGANNIGATYKKLYELLDAAYVDLETTIATEVVVDQAILDAANIADGSTASNRLEYFRKYEGNDGEVVREWSTSKIHYKDGLITTTILANADLDDNGQPIVAKTYAEVNFAHQLGEFLNGLTENDKFALGFIGTSSPASYSNAKIAAWIGTLPELNVDGAIIANGTGLLGNKYMSGSTSRMPGFYKTDTGYPDGIPQQDSNGAYIDLGKFLSVVAGLVTLPASPVAGTTGTAVNGSGMYCGLATTIVAGNSTTNEVVPRVGIPFIIKKPKLDELAGAGYVAFQQKDRGTVVASGELATNANSDYDYISTAIIIRNITNDIRVRLDPYIGKGIDEVKLAAMQTAVDGVMQKAVRDGLIKKYVARVIPTNTFGVTIPYTIVPVFELRDINNVVKLSYDV